MTYKTELATRDTFSIDDVTDRIEEIEDALDVDYPTDPDNADERKEAEIELATLRLFLDDAGDCEDFIHDSYFTIYAQELAEDIGAVDDVDTWPAYCIDWDYAAKELQYDYSCVELDGAIFWCR